MQFLYVLSSDFLSSANGTNYIIGNRFDCMMIHALMHDCSNEDGHSYDHARADSHSCHNSEFHMQFPYVLSCDFPSSANRTNSIVKNDLIA